MSKDVCRLSKEPVLAVHINGHHPSSSQDIFGGLEENNRRKRKVFRLVL